MFIKNREEYRLDDPIATYLRQEGKVLNPAGKI